MSTHVCIFTCMYIYIYTHINTNHSVQWDIYHIYNHVQWYIYIYIIYVYRHMYTYNHTSYRIYTHTPMIHDHRHIVQNISIFSIPPPNSHYDLVLSAWTTKRREPVSWRKEVEFTKEHKDITWLKRILNALPSCNQTSQLEIHSNLGLQ